MYHFYNDGTLHEKISCLSFNSLIILIINIQWITGDTVIAIHHGAQVRNASFKSKEVSYLANPIDGDPCIDRHKSVLIFLFSEQPEKNREFLIEFHRSPDFKG